MLLIVIHIMIQSPQLFDNSDGLDLSVSSKLGRVAGIQQTSNNWPTMTVIRLFSKHFLKGYVLGPTPSESRHESRSHRASTRAEETDDSLHPVGQCWGHDRET